MNSDAWITHTLAIVFSLALLGLVSYTIVGVKNLEMAKVSIGFSSGILGVILGFYFNRERLTAETRERERVTRQRDEVNQLRMELRQQAYQDVLSLAQRIEDEPEEE